MINKLKNLLDYHDTEHIIVSLLFHIAILLCLAGVTTHLKESNKNIIILSSYDENLVDNINTNIEDVTTFSQDITVKPQESSGITSIVSQPDVVVPSYIDDTQMNNDPTNFLSLSAEILKENIQSNIANNTDQHIGVGGVLDRLTPEIIALAQNRDINVIWLFDASISLSNQRKQIKDRISKILLEIGDSSFGTHKINHTVCSFGNTLNILSNEPTDDPDLIKKYIESISLDDSGIENIFGSIISVCDKYKDNRNIIIVFTDEIGDDIENLDKCINVVTRKSTQVYVVGPPAPFGSSKIQFKYVDPDPKFDQKERWVEIQQGPETLFKMTLDLHTIEIDDQGLDSGFGPYGLTRLCNASHGIYFAVHPNRSKDIVLKKQIAPLSSNISRFFDIEIMKRYSPDYRNITVQKNDIGSNPIKLSLIKACQIPLNIIYDQKMNFTAFSEGEFVSQLKDAQNFSARIEPKIDEIYTILKNGEPHINNLKEDRWIVSYYLAMGRILATKCRIELYNLILAEAKSGLKKQDKKTNAWELVRDNEFITQNSQLSKVYNNAQKYLKLVIEKYPNTPWAAIATEELNTPMGYRWVEKYIEPSKPMTGNNNNNNPNPKDDQRKKLEFKPQRKIDKI